MRQRRVHSDLFHPADNSTAAAALYVSDIAFISFAGELRLPVFVRCALGAGSLQAAFCRGRFLPSNFFSTRTPLSTCFSCSKNGGKKRTTVSCVLLKSTPSARA